MFINDNPESLQRSRFAFRGENYGKVGSDGVRLRLNSVSELVNPCESSIFAGINILFMVSCYFKQNLGQGLCAFMGLSGVLGGLGPTYQLFINIFGRYE